MKFPLRVSVQISIRLFNFNKVAAWARWGNLTANAMTHLCLDHSMHQSFCGTCHMASSFLPLPRTARVVICTPSSLLVTTLTQHLASHPRSAPLLKLLRLYQIPSLHSHHLTFMPEFDFWEAIALTQASAPHQIFQHLIHGALLLTKIPGTNASSSSSSYLLS